MRDDDGGREDTDADDAEVEINEEEEEGNGLDLIGLWLIMTLFWG